MKEKLTAEEAYLLKLLANLFLEGRTAAKPRLSQAKQGKKIDYETLFQIAEHHVVLPLLYDSLIDSPFLSDALKEKLETVSRRTALQSYHLLFLSGYIIKRMQESDVLVVLLKGASTSVFYPTPELRKSGDIDLLLLDDEGRERACEILQGMGFGFADKQHAQHHLEYMLWDGIVVELHLMLAEPFDNERMNSYLERKRTECADHVEIGDVMGLSLPVLKDGFHGYYLLLHMLQHFLRSGFGLKLLCDWSAFWSREIKAEEKHVFMKLVKESGLLSFARTISCVCIEFLGLLETWVQFMFEGKSAADICTRADVYAFMQEILEAEEFGKSTKDRMVMLRGAGALSYVREFHHQMRLNFPKTGKAVPLWPALWTVTLVRFAYNNKKIRNVSTRDVLKKAKSRSRIMEKMQLFVPEDEKGRTKKKKG